MLSNSSELQLRGKLGIRDTKTRNKGHYATAFIDFSAVKIQKMENEYEIIFWKKVSWDWAWAMRRQPPKIYAPFLVLSVFEHFMPESWDVIFILFEVIMILEEN